MSKDLTARWAELSEESVGTSSRKDKTLPAGKDAVAIPDRVGKASPKSPSGGSGIASPLTETAYADRLFWTEKLYTSTDGMITIARLPVKEVSFTDANGSPVKMQYQSPT